MTPDVVHIRPQPGPQEAFAATDADVAFMGGSAGGGKTFALVYEAGRWFHVPGYAGVIFRRTATQITGGGSLWEEATKLYPLLGGASREAPNLDWRFDAGASIAFRHLQHEKDRLAHQGRQYAFIGFDELAHFTEPQFWYLLSRLRSTCGVRPYCRATLNPDPDHFARKMVDWYIGDDGYAIPERSGVIRWFARQNDELFWGDTREELVARIPDAEPMSFTFILARNSDNAILAEKDPTYVSKLKNLHRVERLRLLGERDAEGRDRGGNWNVRASAGQYFQKSWFKVVDWPPGLVKRSIRAWDKAATEPTTERPDPDWTRGVRVELLDTGDWFIADVASIRGSPGAVLAKMRRTAELDGRGTTVAIWQDPGQAGKVDRDTTSDALSSYLVRSLRAAKDKIAYAEHWSARAEQGRIYVQRAPWNDAFFAEVEAFPDGPHDDQIDATSLGVQLLKTVRVELDDGYDEYLPTTRM